MTITDQIALLSEESQWTVLNDMLNQLTMPHSEVDMVDQRLEDLKSGKVKGLSHAEFMGELQSENPA